MSSIDVPDVSVVIPCRNEKANAEAMLFGFIGLMGDHLRLISERTRRTLLVLARERVNFLADY